MTPHSTFRLSPTAKRLLARIARRDGVTRTAALERLIRDAARAIGLAK
jgi:hypothetical protein